MKRIKLKFPCCTGVPRPTLVANLDAKEVIISYYTAPICHDVCKTAIIKVKEVTNVESYSLNDEENQYLGFGLMRDGIYVKEEKGKKEYLMLFHNEYIKVKADSIEEHAGENRFIDNIKKYHSMEYERD